MKTAGNVSDPVTASLSCARTDTDGRDAAKTGVNFGVAVVFAGADLVEAAGLASTFLVAAGAVVVFAG
jgi:hypothetical protein